MGQYYIAVNIDKKQRMHFDWSKLTEFSWLGNNSVNAFAALMHGAWKGDRVYIVGDYADGERQDAADDGWLPAYKAIEQEFGLEGRTYMSRGESYPEHLHQFAQNNFEVVDEAAEKLAGDGAKLRYIINEALGIHIDLEHCPADGIEAEKDGSVTEWRVHPLPLLLAMGNNRGGGDFGGNFREVNGTPHAPFQHEHKCFDGTVIVTSHPAIGQWTATTRSIRFTEAGEEAKLDGLTEWQPDFTEVEKPTPWQDIGKVRAALEKKNRIRSKKIPKRSVSRMRPDMVFGCNSAGQITLQLA